MPQDRLIAWHKVGDKQTAPGKEHLGKKDGMVGGYYLQSWLPKGMTFEDAISPWMSNVYACCEYPVEFLPFIKDSMLAVGQPIEEEPIDIQNYRPGKRILLLSDIERLSGISGLEATLRTRNESAGIINLIGKVSESDFKDSTIYKSIPREDPNLITSGDYEIGAGIEYDYLTNGAFVLDFGSPFDGAMTGTLKTFVTEPAVILMIEALGGNDLLLTTDTDPKGNPNTGHIMTMVYDVNDMWDLQGEGPGTLTIDKLQMRVGAISENVGSMFKFHTTTAEYTVQVSNCLLDGNDCIRICLEFGTPNGKPNIYNNKIWDILRRGIFTSNIPTNSLFENNTIYFDNIYSCVLANNLEATWRNNICINLGSGPAFQTVGINTIGRNNASNDDTSQDFAVKSDNIINIVPGDKLESVDRANDHFLDLKLDGSSGLGNAGSAPEIAGNTVGINGVARTSDGYSIGAYQQDYAVAGTSPILLMMTNSNKGAL